MSSQPVTSKYFSKTGERRKSTRKSPAIDTANSPELLKLKQDKEKQKQGTVFGTVCEVENDSDMALQEKLDKINEKLEVLTTAQQDIKQIRLDMDTLTAKLMDQIHKLEGDVFELKTDKDKLNNEVSKLKEENNNLRNQLDQHEKELKNHRLAQNEMEQHGRQWNLWVYGVKEEQQGKTESVTDCVRKCTDIFTEKVGVPVAAEDIEIAHRSGRPGTGRPRPILVRFFSRQKRGTVLEARRKLKQSGVSIGEDLTKDNYNLLMRASKHSATLSAWSSNGKVIVKLKNGKTFKIDINTNLDQTFTKAM